MVYNSGNSIGFFSSVNFLETWENISPGKSPKRNNKRASAINNGSTPDRHFLGHLWNRRGFHSENQNKKTPNDRPSLAATGVRGSLSSIFPSQKVSKSQAEENIDTRIKTKKVLPCTCAPRRYCDGQFVSESPPSSAIVYHFVNQPSMYSKIVCYPDGPTSRCES